MGRIAWYANRLKAMTVAEVAWRLRQKALQRKEKAAYADGRTAVWDGVPEKEFDAEATSINFGCRRFTIRTGISLLGGYSYDDYATRWHAGFQTEKEWPKTFSHGLRYKQRDDIGDARTNWELNRHYQFVLLAKAYYATRDSRYLDELTRQITDWNASNPFLIGISWTSVMEVAIRCINWTVAAAFLRKADSTLANRMMTGVARMAGYVAAHYSRYSSANNHLLVEACSLVYAGSALRRDNWYRLGIRLLDGQLERQNCPDGVNREMSLHYQTFGMEAYALAAVVMRKRGTEVPGRWLDMMRHQCEFVAASMAGDVAIEFGDNDEGKILDLEGGRISHYLYVLQLCSMLTGIRYCSFENVAETVRWLFDEKAIARDMSGYIVPQFTTFPYGGYSFLRTSDGQVAVAVDHAPLGFGSIAAHGHADALSFQLYVRGMCIFGDPGTFIYHCALDRRNEYRRSDHHSTVSRPDSEQSQMLGAFMWGKRAETRLIAAGSGAVEAVCRRADGADHRRLIQVSEGGIITIDDSLSADDGVSTLALHPDCRVAASDGIVKIEREGVVVRVEAAQAPAIDTIYYSERYGTERQSPRISYRLTDRKLRMKIWIEKY